MLTSLKQTEHEGYYVDSSGNIFSMWQHHGRYKRYLDINKPHSLKLHSLPTGHLWVRGKHVTLRANIAVAKAFLSNDNPKTKIYVCHKDGNPKNNNVENLYWGSPAENSQDMERHGTRVLGVHLPQSKMNGEKVNLARLLRADFNWPFLKIAKLFCIDYRTAWNIVNRITWKHIT